MAEIFRELFEGTGTPASWTVSGTGVNPDSTAVVLEGTQSCAIDSPSTTYASIKSPHFDAETSFHLYFRVQITALPASSASIIAEMLDGSSVSVARIQLRSGQNRFTIFHGSVSVDAPVDLVAGTTYHVWLVYTAGTGSDGTLALYYSTTGTRPGAASASITTGTSTAGIEYAAWYANQRGHEPVYYDVLVGADEEIGNNGDLAITPVAGLRFVENLKYLNASSAYANLASVEMNYVVWDADPKTAVTPPNRLDYGAVTTNGTGFIPNIDLDAVSEIDDVVFFEADSADGARWGIRLQMIVSNIAVA